MSKSTERAQTPANSVIWNTAGKGSKQATEGPLGFLPEDRLREICEKNYNQILSIVVEKVHQEKLQGVQTRRPMVKVYGKKHRRKKKLIFLSQTRVTEKEEPRKGEAQVQTPCLEALVLVEARASFPD
ncbi:hypothetical protein Tco_0962198 [Tanacetum coccineum]